MAKAEKIDKRRFSKIKQVVLAGEPLDDVLKANPDLSPEQVDELEKISDKVEVQTLPDLTANQAVELAKFKEERSGEVKPSSSLIPNSSKGVRARRMVKVVKFGLYCNRCGQLTKELFEADYGSFAEASTSIYHKNEAGLEVKDRPIVGRAIRAIISYNQGQLCANCMAEVGHEIISAVDLNHLFNAVLASGKGLICRICHINYISLKEEGRKIKIDFLFQLKPFWKRRFEQAPKVGELAFFLKLGDVKNPVFCGQDLPKVISLLAEQEQECRFLARALFNLALVGKEVVRSETPTKSKKAEKKGD